MTNNRIIEKHSSSVVNGLPKLPTPEQILHGQLVVNFASGYETISLKNSANEMVKFKTEEQNDSTFIHDKESLFTSFKNEMEYEAANKEYPSISWLEDEQTLLYEGVDDVSTERCNIIFEGGLKHSALNSVCKIPNVNLISILFTNPFSTLQIEGLEHKNMSLPKLYENLGSSYPSISALLEPGSQYNGYFKFANKNTTVIADTSDERYQYSAYWFLSPVVYIEINEDFQKCFWNESVNSYELIPLMITNLQTVKFTSPFFITSVESMIQGLGYMLQSFLANLATNTAVQDFIIRIPAQYASSFGSPSDAIIIDENDNITGGLTFMGVINFLNDNISETYASPYRIKVETWNN